ncbi:MAG: hypothetical protein V1749_07860 [Candidatus Desantisbacteria bacterium]
MQKHIFLWIIGAVLLFGTSTVSYATLIGTSGTTAGWKIVSGGDAGIAGITDRAGDVVATYRFDGSGTKNTTCSMATITIGQIYGGKWGTLPNDQNGLPGTTVDYNYQLYNLGNATDVFSLSLNTAGLPTGWKATLPTTTLTVAEDAMASFTVQVFIPDGADANEKGVIMVIASSGNEDGHAYVVDTWQYGGMDTLIAGATTTCASAMIILTKTYEVQTPGSYTGTSTNVPGSIATYCLEYNNTGNMIANNVTTTDMIPRYTTYVTGSMRLGISGSTYDTALYNDDNASDSATEPCANWNAETRVITFILRNVLAGKGGRLYYRVRID